MDAPLRGLLVADFSRVVAGPMVAMQLGDLGATVVKVEHPDGDDPRRWGPPWIDGSDGPEASYFTAVNRNKASVRLDLTDAADLDLARELARRADVVVENFRPGTMERFGLDHATVARTNPAVVTVSIDGFGGTPAAAGLPGYDLVAQAASGLMSVTGTPEGMPTKVGVAVVDVLAALYATIGALGALTERAATGRGRHVRVSLFDAALAALINQAAATVTTGEVPGRLGNEHPSIAPYATFRTADGHVVIAVGNDRQFTALGEVLDTPGLAEDPRFATNTDRVAHRRELRAAIEARTATAPSATWLERLQEAAIPSGPVLDIGGAVAYAERLGLKPVLETHRPDGSVVPTIRSPIRFAPDFDRPATAPPRLGQDDAEVRAWLSTPEA